MLKKYLLRLVCIITLCSFTLPIYAFNSPNQNVPPNNDLTGSGTLEDPWQITDCLDLASLANSRYTSTAQYSRSFVLTQDIDCSDSINWNDGVGFWPVHPTLLSTPWDGNGPIPEQYFDGHNHTISNLYLNVDTSIGGDGGALLFAYVGFGATVKNLKIVNATFNNTGSSNSHHAILTRANYGTIQNVEVNGNINATGSAGLIAAVNMGAIKESKSSGTITSSNGDGVSIGGLVGETAGMPLGYGVNTEISDSYSTANIITNGTSANSICGGLLGKSSILGDGSIQAGSVLIKNSYANANIDCAKTGSYSGGLIGSLTISDYTLQNTFATSSMTTGSGATTGGLVGYNNLYTSFTNSFYDASTTGQSICSSPQNNACTAKNAANSDENYFKNNSINAPLDTWDFANTWETTSTLPILKARVTSPSTVLNVQGTPALTSIELTWDAPIEPAGVAILDYEIIYRPTNTITWETFSDGISNLTTTTVTELASGTEYEFKVRAVNSGGEGLYSDAIIATTTTLPGTTQTAFKGDGSIDNPWQISTCIELQALNNQLYAYNIDSPDNFILTNDIDCSDTINWNDGKGFIPIDLSVMGVAMQEGQTPINDQYFDGRNHTVSNLYIKNPNGGTIALFKGVGVHTTVKNIKIEGAIFINDEQDAKSIASITAYNKGILDNISANVTINNAKGSTNIGGIVAINYGSITRSSSTGTITQTDASYNSIGGLVAKSYSGNIDNSYSTINIFESGNTTTSNSCGGIASGLLYESSVNHSYATGTIYCPSHTQYTNSISGSFAGYAESNSISNSFGTGYTEVNGQGAYHGGLVGTTTHGAQFPNSLFDQSRTGIFYCSAESTNGCQGKNLFNFDMNYFFNTSTRAPFNTWDFTNTWYTTSTYPLLKNVATTPERATKLLGTTTLSTADLTWTAPSDDGGSAITDYEIQYKKADESQWLVFNDGISTNTFATVTGLEEGIIYQYRIRAFNGIGAGLYSYIRSEVQLQTSIESPVETEFEYGDNINYSVSIYNTTTNPIDSIDTAFLADSFVINSITPTSGELGLPPSDLGIITNNENWSGLLESNQEIVFNVSGKVASLANETGKLSFTGTSLKYQGSTIDLGNGDASTIRAESSAFIVKETATNFEITSSLQESGIIDNGDQVHLTFSIINHGPKAGFFTNSVVYIYIPQSINISLIENDNFICSNTVLIDENLSSGIYSSTLR